MYYIYCYNTKTHRYDTLHPRVSGSKNINLMRSKLWWINREPHKCGPHTIKKV